MALIRHITSEEGFRSILECGVIKLELHAFEPSSSADIMTPQGVSKEDFWRQANAGFKLVGRYVWFTEQTGCLNAGIDHSSSKYFFEFDSKDIDAFSWRSVAIARASRGKKQKQAIQRLNATAKDAGDDPLMWWVSKLPVDISKATNHGLLKSN